MKCKQPYIHKELLVPFGCGQCLACRINRRNKWTARLILERALHKEAIFVTLTYSNDFVPNEVKKQHFQLFMKRFRKNSGKEIRFYACGEYGDQFGRPHYHVILYGASFDDVPHLVKSWRFGIIDIGVAEVNSMRYVAGYVSKKYVKAKDDGRAKEFALMSRRPALGSGLLAQFAENAFLQHPFDVLKVFRVGGKNFPFDRLMREKLRDLVMTQEEKEHIKKLNLKLMQEQAQELILEQMGSSLSYEFRKMKLFGSADFSSVEGCRNLLGQSYEKAFFDLASNQELAYKIRSFRKDV